jgi:hypothetical protein
MILSMLGRSTAPYSAFCNNGCSSASVGTIVGPAYIVISPAARRISTQEYMVHYTAAKDETERDRTVAPAEGAADICA